MAINDKYFLNPAHRDLAEARYFLKDDNGKAVEKDIDEVFVRVTDYIYKNDEQKHKEEALKLRREKKIIDAGRPLAQAGTKTENMYNCFILSFEDDTREAISELKRKHFEIQSRGGGTGMNFSTLRPRGSICKRTQARSSGAVGFITDFSYQSSNVGQSGNRSGANIGILEDWHPDLYEFITRKSSSNWENIRKFSNVYDEDEFSYFQWQQPCQWQMFNVSVSLSDKFMSGLASGGKDKWILKWKKEDWHLYKFVNTRGPSTRKETKKYIVVTAPNDDMAWHKASSEIPFFNNDKLELVEGPYDLSIAEWFDIICKNAWEDGCPGIIFMDMARRFHNGEYFNTIVATNPCGEIPGPSRATCCLTSLILPSFFVNGEFLWEDFKKSVYQAVRGLDNIISLNATGEKDIDENSIKERRIGLGTTGIAELLIMNKMKYSSQKGRNFVLKILEFLRDKAYEASIELARERGVFPAFNFDGFSKSEFFKTLPDYIKEDIKKYGIRNVTILTQPPVGSTGTMVGFSQGCEPYFAMCFVRNSRIGSFLDGSPAFVNWLKDKNIDYKEFDYSLAKLREKHEVPEYFEEAHEISWENHLKMQAAFAKYIDSSVSKTINLSNSATIEDVKSAYMMAYKLGIKSTTVYRDGSKQQILEHIVKDAKLKGPHDIINATAPERPSELPCDIFNTTVRGDCWTVLVGLLNEKPYELFIAPQESFELSAKYKTGKIIKNGGGMYHLDMGDFKIKNISNYIKNDEHRVITRLISTCLRHGVPMTFITDQLAKADGTIVDFSKAILRVLKKYDGPEVHAKEHVCSKCGSDNVVVNGGCPECLDCGTSKCG